MKPVTRLFLAAMTAALLALPILAPGCSWFGTSGSPQAQALDCAKAAVTSKIGSVVPEVLTVVRAGGTGWEAALTDIGVRVGEEVLGCAVQAALQELNSLKSLPSPTDGGSSDSAKSRLTSFSVSKGYTYKAVK